ncbi:MAG TPA: TonB family protein [Pyrinomonadaceae bacterium]|nr:TonB family protein [Pyrinomonadaceae bacterium]
MLDQLVESRSNTRENTRRTGFFATTFVVLVVLLLGTFVYSLFAKDFGMDTGELELSALVAPVPVPEEEPPPPPEKEPEPVQKEQKTAPNADVRTVIIQSMAESPKPPDTVSIVKNTVPPRDPSKRTVLGDTNKSFENSVASNYAGAVRTDGKGIAGSTGTDTTGNSGAGDGGAPPPPPPPPPPAPKPTPKPAPPKSISKGVINGSAISLPKPPYPPAARAVRASGAVNVQVTISENGSVISASAVSGHPLLRVAAAQAARSAKFAPTLLSGQPVKVTGVIVYNFVP